MQASIHNRREHDVFKELKVDNISEAFMCGGGKEGENMLLKR